MIMQTEQLSLDFDPTHPTFSLNTHQTVINPIVTNPIVTNQTRANQQRPEFSIRYSQRARRARICISRSGTVEVVVPQGFNPQKIPALVDKHQHWIEQTQNRLALTRQTLCPDSIGKLPQTIELRACGEIWHIHYPPIETTNVTTTATNITLTEEHQNLRLTGAIESLDRCQAALRDWIRRKAKALIIPWLHQISQEIQLPYNRATIRTQKTRWGSCSSKKSINLNDKLLFLPPNLVQYILIHELCHTIYLNHSPQFWTLVAQKEPNYRLLDRSLRQAWAYVPEWME